MISPVFRLQASIQLTIVFLVLTISAAIALCNCGFNLTLKAISLLVLGLNALSIMRRYAWLNHPHAVQTVQLQQNHWLIQINKGESLQANLLSYTGQTAKCLILTWQLLECDKKVTCLVASDSLQLTDFRSLLSLLLVKC